MCLKRQKLENKSAQICKNLRETKKKKSVFIRVFTLVNQYNPRAIKTQT
ncbi:hypothetical protein FLA105535_00044 [Flavobacterium bizetiae]|nr:hypothetical protein FLA105535_00044 [Flavobacterium bizetiae]